MYTKLVYSMTCLLLASLLAATGFVTFLIPLSLEQSTDDDFYELRDSSMVGVWNQQGDEGLYRVHVTPSVVFIVSADEADICEIEVTSHESLDGGGVLHGITRLHRVASQNLSNLKRQVRIDYQLRDEVLQLSWNNECELAPRLASCELILVPGREQYAGYLSHSSLGR